MSNPSGNPWRIDDLAQRAGLTVDTVRYYQAQGLLPPAERCARSSIRHGFPEGLLMDPVNRAPPARTCDVSHGA